MTDLQILGFIYAIIIVLVGVLYSFAQAMSRKPYILGVSMPSYMEEDPQVKGILSDYKKNVLVLSLIFAGLQVLLIYTLGFMAINTFALILSIFLLYLPLIQAQNKLKKIKESRNIKPDRESVVISTQLSENKFEPKKDLIILYLPSLVFIVVSAIWIYLNYQAFPDQIATQIGFDGIPRNFKEKSFLETQNSTLVSLVIWLAMLFSNLAMLKSRYRIRPDMPQESYLHLLKARKLWTYFFGLSSLLLIPTIQIGITYVFTMANYDYANLFGIGLILIIVIMLAVAIALTGKVGVDGSKLDDDQPLTIYRDDDQYWHLGGQIYYNPDDPANFVYKRIGSGVTFNLARPLGKLFIAVLVLMLVLGLVVTFIMELS